MRIIILISLCLLINHSSFAGKSDKTNKGQTAKAQKAAEAAAQKAAEAAAQKAAAKSKKNAPEKIKKNIANVAEKKIPIAVKIIKNVKQIDLKRVLTKIKRETLRRNAKANNSVKSVNSTYPDKLLLQLTIKNLKSRKSRTRGKIKIRKTKKRNLVLYDF